MPKLVKNQSRSTQNDQNSYYTFLVWETIQLKEQKLKELLELEDLLRQLNILVEKNII
jgi:hypothetical protein